MDLSLCIPTRLRPALLARTLESILEADLRPDEVLLGDNGGGDAGTAEVVARFQGRLPVRHVVHDPPLGYGGNLRFLLQSARGDWLGLIHDDDFFLPGCGDLVRAARASGADVWFSDHLIATHDGALDPEASARNTAAYGRDRLAAGPLRDPMAAVLRNQVCMDGWFARREALAGLTLDPRWMDFADAQILVGLAAGGWRWRYEPTPVFAYRANQAGLTPAGLKLHVLYGFLESLSLPAPEHAALRDERLRRYAPGAVAGWLKSGDRAAARRCLASRHYPAPRTLRAAARLALQLARAAWPGGSPGAPR